MPTSSIHQKKTGHTSRLSTISAASPERSVILIAGRKHRFIYMSAALHPTLNRPQQALVKLDSETLETKMWRRDVHYYVGEPVFVPLSEGRQFPRR